MKKDDTEFIRVKAWLFRHQVPSWGEEVAACLFFSLMAWSVWKGRG